MVNKIAQETLRNIYFIFSNIPDGRQKTTLGLYVKKKSWKGKFTEFIEQIQKPKNLKIGLSLSSEDTLNM